MAFLLLQHRGEELPNKYEVTDDVNFENALHKLVVFINNVRGSRHARIVYENRRAPKITANRFRGLANSR